MRSLWLQPKHVAAAHRVCTGCAPARSEGTETETETFSGVNAALQGDMPHTRRSGLGLAIAQPAAPRAGPGWPRAPARCSPRVSKATELQVLATSHPSDFC